MSDGYMKGMKKRMKRVKNTISKFKISMIGFFLVYVGTLFFCCGKTVVGIILSAIGFVYIGICIMNHDRDDNAHKRAISARISRAIHNTNEVVDEILSTCEKWAGSDEQRQSELERLRKIKITLEQGKDGEEHNDE